MDGSSSARRGLAEIEVRQVRFLKAERTALNFLQLERGRYPDPTFRRKNKTLPDRIARYPENDPRIAVPGEKSGPRRKQEQSPVESGRMALIRTTILK